MSQDWEIVYMETCCQETRHKITSVEGTTKKLKELSTFVKRRHALKFLEEVAVPENINSSTWNEYSRVQKWKKLIELKSEHCHPWLRSLFEIIGDMTNEEKLQKVEQLFNVIYEDMDRSLKKEKPLKRKDSVIESAFNFLDRMFGNKSLSL